MVLLEWKFITRINRESDPIKRCTGCKKELISGINITAARMAYHDYRCADCEQKYYQEHSSERKTYLKERNKNHPEIKKTYKTKKAERYWAWWALRDHRREGYAVNLSVDDLEQLALTTKVCPIGDEALDYLPYKGQKAYRATPTLDRITNGDVIDKETVWIICKFHNTMKLNRPFAEWIEFCSSIANKKEQILAAAKLQTRFVQYVKTASRSFDAFPDEKTWAHGSIGAHKNALGYDCSVTTSQLVALAACVSDCFICGSTLDYRRGVGHKPKQNTPSVDVLDGSKRMSPDNVVIMCNFCNILKQNLSLNALIVECQRISYRFSH